VTNASFVGFWVSWEQNYRRVVGLLGMVVFVPVAFEGVVVVPLFWYVLFFLGGRFPIAKVSVATDPNKNAITIIRPIHFFASILM